MILVSAFAIGFAWTLHFQNHEAGGESDPEDQSDRLISMLRYRVEVVKREPSWIDDMGIALGLSWLLQSLL